LIQPSKSALYYHLLLDDTQTRQLSRA